MGGPAVRDVVFDLGGVLIDWDPRYLFCRHLGADPGKVDVFLREVCTPDWHARIDSGGRFADAARELAVRFPQHADWIARYGAEWQRMFAGAHGEAVDCLQELRRRGYRLHALSNYPGEQVAFLYRAYPFMRHFHTVVLSGIVRMCKPEPAIFAYLSEVLGRRPMLFIDDRPENVAAARACGLQAVQFRPGEGLRALVAALPEITGDEAQPTTAADALPAAACALDHDAVH